MHEEKPVLNKVGKMPANKHICHASGIYQEILRNNGKKWEILANMIYNLPQLDW